MYVYAIRDHLVSTKARVLLQFPEKKEKVNDWRYYLQKYWEIVKVFMAFQLSVKPPFGIMN